MVLSDIDIIEQVASYGLEINPYNEDNVEPASVDLRLGEEFHRANPTKSEAIDLSNSTGNEIDWVTQKDSIEIRPNDFVLATTLEKVNIPDNIVAQVEGRSSTGRVGVSVHQTAGYIDPGFEGQITLELTNHGPVPVTVQKGLRICQIVFTKLSSPSIDPYGHEGSQYQGQSGATKSGMSFD